MSFVRAASPTYFAPASFTTLDGNGRLVEHKFDCQFKRLKREELEELDAAVSSANATASDANSSEGDASAPVAKPGSTDQMVLERVMVGWRAVQEADGTELQFSLEAVEETERLFPGFRAACVKSFYLSTSPKQAAWLAAAKN